MIDLKRDDFTLTTKNKLCLSVGCTCSICSRTTNGPNKKYDNSINIGVAAHITAASPNGPRYDKKISSVQRKHFDNGIWLCQNCANLIDKDPEAYPVNDLKKFKFEAMKKQDINLNNEDFKNIIVYSNRDINLLNYYANILSYNYLESLSLEKFGAIVYHNITEPLYLVLSKMHNPLYIFINKELESIRTNLNNAIKDFFDYFGQYSAGMIGYYEYIDENIKRQSTKTEDDWAECSYKTHQLAMVIYDKAYLILQKSQGL